MNEVQKVLQARMERINRLGGRFWDWAAYGGSQKHWDWADWLFRERDRISAELARMGGPRKYPLYPPQEAATGCEDDCGWCHHRCF